MPRFKFDEINLGKKLYLKDLYAHLRGWVIVRILLKYIHSYQLIRENFASDNFIAHLKNPASSLDGEQ